MTKVKKLGAHMYDKVGTPLSIEYSEREIEIFWEKRMACAKRSTDLNINSINLFFETPKVDLPGKQELSRSWGQWISKSSRNKPRDMVALMQFLIEESKNYNEKISSKTASKIIDRFSESRVDFLEREYEQIFPQIKNSIDLICRESPNTDMSFKEITEILKKIPSSFAGGITINGKIVRANQIGDAIEILKIVHMANFINPKVPADKLEGYDHIIFEEKNEFIKSEKISELERYNYEIHPVFHSYVKKIKSEKLEYEKNSSKFKENIRMKKARK